MKNHSIHSSGWSANLFLIIAALVGVFLLPHLKAAEQTLTGTYTIGPVKTVSTLPRVLTISLLPESLKRHALLRGDYNKSLGSWMLQNDGTQPLPYGFITIKVSNAVSWLNILVDNNWYNPILIRQDADGAVYTAVFEGTLQPGQKVTVKTLVGIGSDVSNQDAWAQLYWLNYQADKINLPTREPVPQSVNDSVEFRGDAHQLFNADVAPGKPALVGFDVVADEYHTVRYIIRVAGPALAQLGEKNALEDPFVQVYDSNGKLVDYGTNDNWGDNRAVDASLFAEYGMFPFPAGSKDSAVILDLPKGSYTIQVKGFGSGSGRVAIEKQLVPPSVFTGEKG